MVKGCCVHGCTANSVRNANRKFAIIPKEAVRRKKWLRVINRTHVNTDGSVNTSKLWSPTSKHTYVCSAHFVSGDKINDPCHVDYVPSIFPQLESATRKSEKKIDRYKRAIKGFKAKPEKNAPSTKKARRCLQPTSNPHLVILNSPGESNQQVLLDVGEENVHLETNTCDTASDKTVEKETLDKPMEQSEREIFHTEINNLRRERDEALERVKSLEKLLCVTSLSSSSVEGNNSACQMMTGLSWGVFLQTFTFLCTFVKPCANAKIFPREQFFLTLLKLRHNLTYEFLAHLKGVPKPTFIDYFWKWIDLMYTKLSFLIRWADRETIFKIVPPVFKKKFLRLTSIIDCFEIFIESPKNLLARAQCYSNYKKHTTVKFFISCNPLGAINFLSRAWGGRASDIQIVRESGFISQSYHMPGDQILADRGFTLHDDFAAKCNAELITPAFTKGKKQLSAHDVERSRSISSVCIHIERVIGLIKNRYSILKGTLPVRCIQSLKDESMDAAISSCDKIITVCAALTNLGPSIVFKE